MLVHSCQVDSALSQKYIHPGVQKCHILGGLVTSVWCSLNLKCCWEFVFIAIHIQVQCDFEKAFFRSLLRANWPI